MDSPPLASNAKYLTGFPPSGSPHCPICDYSLEGLPKNHTCPECGLRFDERSMLIERDPIADRSEAWSLAAKIFVTVFASVAIPLFLIIAYFNFNVHGGALLFLTLAFSLTVPGVYLMKRGRRTSFVFMSTEGMLIKRNLPWLRRIPWSRVEDADIRELGGQDVLIIRTNRGLNVRFPSEMIRHPDAYKLIYQTIHIYRTRARLAEKKRMAMPVEDKE